MWNTKRVPAFRKFMRSYECLYRLLYDNGFHARHKAEWTLGRSKYISSSIISQLSHHVCHLVNSGFIHYSNNIDCHSNLIFPLLTFKTKTGWSFVIQINSILNTQNVLSMSRLGSTTDDSYCILLTWRKYMSGFRQRGQQAGAQSLQPIWTVFNLTAASHSAWLQIIVHREVC